MKAILISPGFGSGWSSYADEPEQARFFLTHEGLIEAILSRTDIGWDEARHEPLDGSPLAQFVADFHERFPDAGDPYLGGARDLRVALVPDDALFLIHEYDGSESIALRDEMEWFDARTL